LAKEEFCEGVQVGGLMTSFRSKPVGWKGESYRHYLAAKGMTTKRYFVPRSEAKFLSLYHGTTKEALPKILTEGLVPQEGGVRGTRGYVHITPNMMIAKQHAGGSEQKFSDLLYKEVEKNAKEGHPLRGVSSDRLDEIKNVVGGTPAVVKVKVSTDELRGSPETKSGAVNPDMEVSEWVAETTPRFPEEGFERYEYLVKHIPPENIREVPMRDVIRKSVKPNKKYSPGLYTEPFTWKDMARVKAAKMEANEEYVNR
jgi:hypothetical protein